MKFLKPRNIILLVLCTIAAWFTWHWRYEIADRVRDVLGIVMPENPRPAGITDLEWAELNYKDEVATLATQHDLPYEYLMALLVLECRGYKPAGNRFERHIFTQLKNVRDGKKRKLENVHPEHLANLDDDGLKNLATSWGPFQLMGYKVIGLGVNVRALRHEESAAEIGVEWIKKEYGHFLKKKKYKDAFHYHNTGERFPLSGHSHTHNPYYVSDGLRYMKYFASRNPNAVSQNK